MESELTNFSFLYQIIYKIYAFHSFRGRGYYRNQYGRPMNNNYRSGGGMQQYNNNRNRNPQNGSNGRNFNQGQQQQQSQNKQPSTAAAADK